MKLTDKTTQFWLRAKAQAIIDSHSTGETTSHSTKRDETCAKSLVISQLAGKSLVIPRINSDFAIVS